MVDGSMVYYHKKPHRSVSVYPRIPVAMQVIIQSQRCFRHSSLLFSEVINTPLIKSDFIFVD